MEQARIEALKIDNQPQNPKKRMLAYVQDQENYQPFMIKRFSKSFENSMAFTDINNFGINSNKFEDLERDSYVFRNDSDQEKWSSYKLKIQKENESKIEKMKDLLPIHLSSKLNEQYLTFLRKVALIDSILQKKQSFHCKQAFQNIKTQLNQQSGFLLDRSLLKKIHFLDENYYCFHVDPLKNFVISLPNRAVSLHLRKYELRKKVYQFALSKVYKPENLVDYKEQIPERELSISRIQLFYPIITKITKVSQESQRKSMFIESIKKQIQSKQSLIQDKLFKEDTSQSTEQELREFTELLCQAFKKYKVKSMFRVSLIDRILKDGIQLQMIMRNLQKIIQYGTFIKRIILPTKPMIYQIDETQKQATIQKIIETQIKST